MNATLIVTADDDTPYETTFTVAELRLVAGKDGASVTNPEKAISSVGSFGSNVLVTLRGDDGPIQCSSNWEEFVRLVGRLERLSLVKVLSAFSS